LSLTHMRSQTWWCEQAFKASQTETQKAMSFQFAKDVKDVFRRLVLDETTSIQPMYPKLAASILQASIRRHSVMHTVKNESFPDSSEPKRAQLSAVPKIDSEDHSHQHASSSCIPTPSRPSASARLRTERSTVAADGGEHSSTMVEVSSNHVVWDGRTFRMQDSGVAITSLCTQRGIDDTRFVDRAGARGTLRPSTAGPAQQRKDPIFVPCSDRSS
jgi:hypothetical protein